MDLEIKKNLASNWFKMLQNSICDEIKNLENNKIKFKSTSWKRNRKKDEGGGEYRILKNGKIFETCSKKIVFVFHVPYVISVLPVSSIKTHTL